MSQPASHIQKGTLNTLDARHNTTRTHTCARAQTHTPTHTPVVWVCDGLDDSLATWLEHAADSGKVRAQVLMANCLNHLNAHHTIEGSSTCVAHEGRHIWKFNARRSLLAWPKVPLSGRGTGIDTRKS
eukprot:1160525-Pelagomonas_calceolata.AAC.8